MADLMNAFKQALLSAGPGLVAQIQGDTESAQAFYKSAANQIAQQKANRDKEFSQHMKLKDMAINIEKARQSGALQEKRQEYLDQSMKLKQLQALRGKPDSTKLQQLRDTYNTKTNNPTAFDPSRRDNAIIDMITGEPVEEVYTGVQNRFNTKRGDTLTKELNKEWERQTPVKTVMNALDVAEDILEKGAAAVEKSNSLFEFTKMGFTGKARAAMHKVWSSSDFFEFDEIDQLFDNYSGNATQIIANQVRSFTGAQATDAERDFLLQMAPDPRVSVAANRIRIANLRRMMKFLDDRNKAIEARIGKKITNVAAEMAAGQDLFTFAKENNILIPSDEDTSASRHTAINRNEQMLLDELNNIDQEIADAINKYKASKNPKE